MIWDNKDYDIFIEYLKPGVDEIIKLSNKDALVEDAPQEARDAFERFYKKLREDRERGMFS